MKTVGLFFLCFFVIVALSVFTAWVERNNGIPNVFAIYFPEHFVDEEDQQALEVMEAPFAAAENSANPVQLDPDIVYDPLGGSISVTDTLNIPHRHEAAISAWVTEQVADALTFTLAGFNDHRTHIAGYMSQNGEEEFRGFLQSAKVLGLMQTGGYSLVGSVLDVPELKTSGDAGGRYRWLYDLEVLLTFLPEGLSSYERVDDSAYQSERLVFRIQIARTPEGVAEDGMVIETWEVLKRVTDG